MQREAYLGELKSLAELRVEHAQDPLVRLLVEAAKLHTEANLRVVELAEAASNELAGTESKRQPNQTTSRSLAPRRSARSPASSRPIGRTAQASFPDSNSQSRIVAG